MRVVTTASSNAPPILLPELSKITSAPPRWAESCREVRGLCLLPGKTVPQHGQTTFALLPLAFVAIGSMTPGRWCSLPCPCTMRNLIGPPRGLAAIKSATHSPSSASRKYRALAAPFLDNHADLKIGISAPQSEAS